MGKTPSITLILRFTAHNCGRVIGTVVESPAAVQLVQKVYNGCTMCKLEDT